MRTTGGEQFVSYLFALEYILQLIGRSDMLPYINKISCRKRRHAYRYRLDRIFSNFQISSTLHAPA